MVRNFSLSNKTIQCTINTIAGEVQIVVIEGRGVVEKRQIMMQKSAFLNTEAYESQRLSVFSTDSQLLDRFTTLDK